MRSALGTVLVFLLSGFSFAAQPDRITTAIDSSEMVVLPGNVHGNAQAQYDRGLVDPEMQLDYITMQMQPSASQQAALTRLIAQQQDPKSANYRKWLTPEQYADRFGLSANDVANLTSWLEGQGFQIIRVARGRDSIAFSGTVAMVEGTFRTQIHQYEVEGGSHFSNSTPLSVPKALASVVVGFRGLNDFALRPMGIRPAVSDFFPDVLRPFYMGGAQGNLLAPDDIATIYDIFPLYNAGINGAGQKLVIAGQTDIDLTDIENFRNGFNLPLNPPQIVVVGPDPGTTADIGEADLDLEWSGAVARNATIFFVTSKISSGGVFNSASYAIDNKTAPVISMSYGGCESENAGFIPGNETGTMQKASAEGITFIASSGDSGAAGCDSSNATSATKGLAVNYPASSPEATGVGGTTFNEGSGTYWSQSNGPNGGSALSYIPETGWNDTTINIQFGGGLSASGGGKSSCGVITGTQTCSAGFPAPTWQAGVSKDTVRDVPDVAMAASADHDGFILCSQGSCPTGDSAGITASVNAGTIVGGTSLGAPVFAGIVTLMNQFLASSGQGNINIQLYPLASKPNGVFHDITTGNNQVPCTQGSTNCPAKAPFVIGYSAVAGYDRVTGIGSVDANCLSTQLGSKGDCTTVSLGVSPSQVNVGGGPVTLTATVGSPTGPTTPSGNVTFSQGATPVGSAALSSGTATLSYDPSKLSAGVYNLTASYAGVSPFASSSSSAMPLTVGTATTTSLSLSGTSVPPGTKVTLTATVIGNPPDNDPVNFTDQLTNTSLGTGTLKSGQATATISPKAGTYLVVASYPGNTTAGIANSASPHQQLGVVDFSIAANPTTVAVSSPGMSGTTIITVTPLGGFNQNLSYTCSTNLPSGAICTFTAASSTSETLTITTTAPSGKLEPGLGRGSQFFYALLLPGIFGVVLLSGKTKANQRGVKGVAVLALLTIGTMWMPACGGGNSSPSTPTNPGTPTGSSAITITAATSGTSPISHTTQVTLSIQ